MRCDDTAQPTKLSGIHRVMEPPDPIPNSEVKRGIADGSVGSPHVRVGQCQTYTAKALPVSQITEGLFLWMKESFQVLLLGYSCGIGLA